MGISRFHFLAALLLIAVGVGLGYQLRLPVKDLSQFDSVLLEPEAVQSPSAIEEKSVSQSKPLLASLQDSLQSVIGVNNANFELAAEVNLDNKNIVSGVVTPPPALKDCPFETNSSPVVGPVIINEVAWMGTQDGYAKEWLELKNISSSTQDISYWQVKDANEDISVVFEKSTFVPAGGFLLLERSDDDAVPEVGADVIYKGTLGNENEGLKLFNENCQIVDSVLADSYWPAGDNGSKRTMERSADLNWHTYFGNGFGPLNALILGSPRKENSRPEDAPLIASSVPPPSSADSGQAAPSPTPPPVPPPAPASAPLKLLISEVQISGVSASDEFVEFYNPNDIAVDLTDWSLKRKSSSGTEYYLVVAGRLDGKAIPAKKYFLLANEEGYQGSVKSDVSWPKSYTLASNNTVLLYGADGAVVDKVGFGTASDFEGTAASNPAGGESLSRQNNQDTDNNASDFFLTAPAPTNSSQ